MKKETTIKPFKLGKTQLRILFSLEEKPKTKVDLCKEFWNEIYHMADRKTKDGFKSYIQSSLGLLKTQGLIEKAERGYKLHSVNNFNKYLRIYHGTSGRR